MNNSPPVESAKSASRIQLRNRKRILDAALEVFSTHGYRGATLDQIADKAQLSKPNILYYYNGKEDIHITLLSQLIEEWLGPLRRINPDGDALGEIRAYIRSKVEMSWAKPRESRLFANAVLQGAPRMNPRQDSRLRELFDEKTELFGRWMKEGKLAPCDPAHLMFSIWATTQHYADFQAQIQLLATGRQNNMQEAAAYLDLMFTKLLAP